MRIFSDRGMQPVQPVMRGRWRAGIALTLCFVGLASLPAVAQEPADGQRFWPQWRGPDGTGVAPHADPPTSWSESSNIRWKVEIPGLGSATPVIWGDRVFVLTAVPVGDEVSSSDGLFTRLRRQVTGSTGASRAQQFVVLALDRRDGLADLLLVAVEQRRVDVAVACVDRGADAVPAGVVEQGGAAEAQLRDGALLAALAALGGVELERGGAARRHLGNGN